jgi:hypothetical protein
MSVYWKDLAERVVVTFIQGTLGSLVVTELSGKDMWLAAAGGGVAAVASLLKGLVAKRIGSPDSASMTSDV